MANMIIKRWDTTANEGSGGWQALSPKVNFNDIVVDVGAGTPVSIFENNKLKIGYLPDAVFDSLLFASTLAADGNSPADIAAVTTALDGALYSAQNIGRSLKGSYFVINVAGAISANASATKATTSNYDAGSEPYFTYSFSNNDAGSTSVSTSGPMEVGDWIVIEQVSGSGTSGSPYAITFSVVSNVYEIMSGATGTVAGAPGLVPQPAATDNLKFLRGDATWVTPTDTNTTYTHTFQDSGDNAILRLTAGGSGTGNDDLTFVAGSNITLTPSGDNLTIDSTDTTYGVSAVDHASDTNSKLIRLTDSNGGNDDIRLTASTNMSISRNGDQIILSSASYTAGVGLDLSSNEFSMEYPMAVSTTAPAEAYEVSGALWFDLETI